MCWTTKTLDYEKQLIYAATSVFADVISSSFLFSSFSFIISPIFTRLGTYLLLQHHLNYQHHQTQSNALSLTFTTTNITTPTPSTSILYYVYFIFPNHFCVCACSIDCNLQTFLSITRTLLKLLCFPTTFFLYVSQFDYWKLPPSEPNQTVITRNLVNPV